MNVTIHIEYFHNHSNLSSWAKIADQILDTNQLIIVLMKVLIVQDISAPLECFAFLPVIAFVDGSCRGQ